MRFVDDLHLNLGLDVAAFETQRSEGLPPFMINPRHQRVYAAFVRTDAVGMTFIQREQVPAVLQDNSGLRL